ncbi:MAG: hypothetical protein RR657_07460 [Peptostreptococcaceae bacterium]
MIKAKNKIYVGSNPGGYLDPDIMTVIFEYLAEHNIRDHSKAKPRKIGDNYLLEIEANESTKQLILQFKKMRSIKLYKRTQSWEEILQLSKSSSQSS